MQRLNLEQARKQAKELLRSARAGDGEARQRIGGELRLADAQRAIARELGFRGWAELKHEAEAARTSFDERARLFVLDATVGRLGRARRRLERDPAIAEAGPAQALVLGDRAAVERELSRDPGFATQAVGPRGWPPLLTVAHSAFLADPQRAAGLVATAELLLAHGADPDASADSPDWPGSVWSPLYGAAGRAHDPELTRVLLEAGANPDDGESLYHSTEAASPECLRLLLAHDAETRGTNALPHALDYDRIEPVRMLLEAGADPNEAANVAHAVRRGRGPEFVRLLVEHGADVDRPGGETWRGDARLRTPYQHAVLRGRDDVAGALEELGADTAVDLADLAVAAIARGERPRTPLPATLDYDAQEVVILAALRGRARLVVELLGPDFRGVIGGSPAGTALHHASWMGDAEVVGELLASGVDPGIVATAELDTPLGWAAHGSQHNRAPADYVAVAELLVAAGNEVEPRFLETADGPLADWLEDSVGEPMVPPRAPSFWARRGGRS